MDIEEFNRPKQDYDGYIGRESDYDNVVTHQLLIPPKTISNLIIIQIRQIKRSGQQVGYGRRMPHANLMNGLGKILPKLRTL
ncbi:hypothetical protein IKF04_03715 [Candidatus Saccharibacteria bacterium]|nr:hypothetical protein [Candidatus Saccharibacteria bacterium]